MHKGTEHSAPDAAPPPLQMAPYLRGEWHTSKVGLLAPAEQRILSAVDALLGAVPVWFRVRQCCFILGSVAARLAVRACSWGGCSGARHPSWHT